MSEERSPTPEAQPEHDSESPYLGDAEPRTAAREVLDLLGNAVVTAGATGAALVLIGGMCAPMSGASRSVHLRWQERRQATDAAIAAEGSGQRKEMEGAHNEGKRDEPMEERSAL